MDAPTVLASMPFDVTLRDALGERLAVLPHECESSALLGTVPKSVASPHSAEEIALALRTAAAEGAVAVLRGNGTKSHKPPRPHAIDILISMKGCAGIVEHAAADLTVTVKAGTALSDVDRALAAAGQFWPCDAPFAESATIGGTLGANANGALRQRYGAVRDLILGARIVTADGRIVRSGARVVKSVAGYDIHKLLVGSRGSLAAIVETTLKVAPLPETERTLVARFASPSDACAAAQTIANSQLFPMAMTLHDDASARRVGAFLPQAAANRWLLTVRCGGNRRSVARQISESAAACRASAAESTADLDRGGTRRCWKAVRELAGGAQYADEDFISTKIVAPPAQTPAALALAHEAWPSAELSAHPWAGAVFINVPGSAQENGAAKRFAAAFARCSENGWSASVTGAPALAADWLPADSVRGTPRRLLRALKAALDPNGTLDPGRMHGGV